ncbi:MAG: Fe-S protein [Alphaproteobacteria bacterium]|nr:Fe-S protein [Alphaproteobacteria bacterium]MBT4018471.1 Fe-S protein [Alphaproteobacteria bacterium]MBT5161321.1 Fe-S protein [Alphaproteobacteria bacterium]MBT5919957.1 Fe-S protein [Alphaproteobacteria bacterium]MBT6386052.1 Fe-S protein [Alphaproteobacteria bacterium]
MGEKQFRERPFSHGPYPLELLSHDTTLADKEAAAPRLVNQPASTSNGNSLSQALEEYTAHLKPFLVGDAAPLGAVPDDPGLRMSDVKGACYFLDAAAVGICQIPENAWTDAAVSGHTHAVVFLVEHGRIPEYENLAHEWVSGCAQQNGTLFTAEIAAVVSGHIRALGFAAQGHVPGNSGVDADRLAVMSGLAVRTDEGLRHPHIGTRFSIGVITTAYELPCDTALSPSALREFRFGFWAGMHGGTSGREHARKAKRRTDLGKYPMETVNRVDRPTTLILDDEVPRIPKRASMFDRALRGDLGAKTVKERNRFSLKSPFGAGLVGPIGALHPLQDREAKEVDTSRYLDPVANAKAIKSLSYFLGADITGICEIPAYAWYSHRGDGSEIVPYQKYAVIMQIDQGYETMEGASGDDWISGSQSMRAYLRGAEIAGVMAKHLRNTGFSSTPQTNTNSEVLQLPLSLLAGLGEMSRIGELVLNPFVGPRLKTVVMTTDMPLAVDKPIDFGLQYFCNNCYKCARECPCDAIPWGDKIMFNGYEIWKPDVERCARYRLTNRKGSACGRCMKTCPLNKVVTADGSLLTRFASWCGVHLLWAKPLMVPIATWFDDYQGHGRRVLPKKWWLDLEVVDGVCVEPFGANQHELDVDKVIDPAKQKMATYTANLYPPPNVFDPVPVDRKAALATTEELETVEGAIARKAKGGAKPAHYIATPPR